MLSEGLMKLVIVHHVFVTVWRNPWPWVDDLEPIRAGPCGGMNRDCGTMAGQPQQQQ